MRIRELNEKLYSLLLIGSFFSLILQSAQADPSFHSFEHNNSKAVLVDFKEALYEVVIDFNKKTSFVNSSIKFEQKEKGHPIFDLSNHVFEARLEGQEVNTPEISSPDGATKFRIINKVTSPGEHVLNVKNDIDEFTQRIDFSGGEANLAMWLSDLSDREFLEIFVPSNFEFDQYKMTFKFTIIGTNIEHEVYSNGKITKSKNSFIIEFPDYFNSSSPYIHLTPSDIYLEEKTTFESTCGRKVGVTIYSPTLEVIEETKNSIQSIISELEEKIAPWPHESLLINVYEGGGGMEYAGATETGIEALRHEIIHSYFARGVMPADGKSSWIDEAITEWMENGYKQFKSPCSQSAECSLEINSLDNFTRHTTLFYHEGEQFIGYLDLKFADKGGMIPFLSHFFKKYKFKTVTTEVFKLELESYFDEDLEPIFRNYVY